MMSEDDCDRADLARDEQKERKLEKMTDQPTRPGPHFDPQEPSRYETEPQPTRPEPYTLEEWKQIRELKQTPRGSWCNREDPTIDHLFARVAELRSLYEESTLSGLDYERERNEARAEVETLKKIINEDGLECLPKCSSFGHEELCPYSNPGDAYRAMRVEVERLKADFRDASGGISSGVYAEALKHGRDSARMFAKDFRELHSS